MSCGGLQPRPPTSMSVFLSAHSPRSVIPGWVSYAHSCDYTLLLVPLPPNSQAVGYFKPKLKTPLS